jgi:periplasmic protein TonB
MFEDALMESGGRISTHRGRFSGVAAICNGSIVCILVLLPLLHPASLPKQTMSLLLAAPAPSLPPMRRVNVASRTAPPVNPFTAPSVIPDRITAADHELAPPMVGTGINPLARQSGTLLEGLSDSIGKAVPLQVRVTTPRKLAISSGVMAGRKLSGVEPRYPSIAVAARIHGTVLLAATISRTGAIENLRVASGPPMLAPAAVEAVRTWRYQPYLLNGEPVEVETTVQVIFHLGG